LSSVDVPASADADPVPPLPLPGSVDMSEGTSDISTASRDCSPLEADALATPEWLKIKKGFEAHSIYSIDMSPVETQDVAPVSVASRARY
jgi:hypothetical protein